MSSKKRVRFMDTNDVFPIDENYSMDGDRRIGNGGTPGGKMTTVTYSREKSHGGFPKKTSHLEVLIRKSEKREFHRLYMKIMNLILDFNMCTVLITRICRG
ncbi:hypothetical protein C5167_051055 [Papaver somniferum]|uniref:Uncharacterized protein n=1 Tax=Papaver somniferum TaxID=3469 RepID=A0A4Y7KT85_PAPSO|nr:hypothetical protein C5167_051055 [Papaver somniferum]